MATVERGDEPVEALLSDDVRLLYNALLDRNPESDHAIENAIAYKTRARLREEILRSPEYRGKNQVRDRLNNLPLNLPPLDITADADGEDRDRLYRHIQATWTALGEDQPHWSVLSSERYRGDVSEEAERAFFESGAQDRQSIEAILARAGREPQEFRHALEYGCGIGRVSFHLARMFPRVTAVDISPSHLQVAYDKSKVIEGGSRVSFKQAELPHFALDENCDLFYSRIVLQHNPPPLIAAILRRALAFLNPGGIAIFQVPTYHVKYAFSLEKYFKSLEKNERIEMHCLKQDQVFSIIDSSGCRVKEVREDNAVDIPSYWISNTFVVEKRS